MIATTPDARVAQWIEEYSGSDVSLGYLLCDRHCSDPGRIALRYEDAGGVSSNLSFEELREQSSRAAGAFRKLGIMRGDRVATLVPKGPALTIAALGLWRLGAVHVPLFTAFGPQAIELRVRNAGVKAIITDVTNRGKLTDLNLDVTIITIASEPENVPVDDVAFWTVLEEATPLEESAQLSGDDLMILLYTSGTTGHPKGVPVPVKALAAFETYYHYGLDVREDDVIWNVADPGWAYGLFYALVAPLLLGKATLIYNSPFNAEGIYQVLQKYGITNFAAAPTVYRAMRAAGTQALDRERLKLRVASSAGEPLNPDVVSWAEAELGIPIYDHYGQTELAMLVNNHHHPELQQPLRPGAMGQPMPGFHAVILDESGEELGPGEEGQIAIDVTASTLFWFPGYYNDPKWTAERFTADGRYYLTGDAASKDDAGYFWFSGRDDDIIISAGYRIGPFEVESALMGHPAVAESAVVGSPDELRGQVVKAFVVLRDDYSPSSGLEEELSQFVKRTLSAHAYPRKIIFLDELPKTPSGKVQRFLLRESP